ncbi:DODA-type extradiol aromatic ring-opening family dioxygenase [Leptolyngbya ohadii]|uniref:DODA-type extradiol aromatic ring-opening family dioxygenase n=1 Tax=Leptolyngbya ohadii TaxID=1962290 RepID=UPI000B59EEB8|nr:class III extradiol ring-cleavage dioxygenase [Leptolyngbya ohadii]
MSFPSLFVSHGSPDLSLHSGKSLDFFKQLGLQLGRPEAILAISAHWLSAEPTVSGAARPATIHDFGGFPAELYQIQYPAPGAVELATEVQSLLTNAGFAAQTHPDRGLDHGVWTPLMLMYPDADIPVTQLSIQPRRDPAYHFRLGQALAPLRDRNVLILASGSLTHNLGALDRGNFAADPAYWAVAFDEWISQTIAQGNTEALLNYRELAPFAIENHPTDEHLLPLFVAAGAGGNHPVQLHADFTYGSLSMASYAFA